MSLRRGPRVKTRAAHPPTSLSHSSKPMELTWSPDYCLACDRQTSGGAYCSQSCRLADLDSSSAWSTPQTSPLTSTFPAATATATTPISTHTMAPTGFYLAPAIDWSAYRTPHTTTQRSYFSSTASTQSNTHSKSLTPSSSRSSLSSSNSASSQHGQFSEAVHSQLQAYANCFDTSRYRRKTWTS